MPGSGAPRDSSACTVFLWAHEKHNPWVEGPFGVPGPGPSTQPKKKKKKNGLGQTHTHTWVRTLQNKAWPQDMPGLWQAARVSSDGPQFCDTCHANTTWHCTHCMYILIAL